MKKTLMNGSLLFKHMRKENRWKVEKKDFKRFHDHLLRYFEQTPSFDRELLEQMGHGELDDRELDLISSLFNADYSDKKKLLLTEAFPERLLLSEEHSFMLYLYPLVGSPYDDFSVLPVQMKLR